MSDSRVMPSHVSCRWQQQCDHLRKNAAVGRTRPGDRRVAGGLRVVVDHHILLIEGQGAI